MSSEGLDWQIVTRQRVRREAGWLALLGMLMLLFGWQFLAARSGTGFGVALSNAYVWTLRVGGMFFIVLAAASLTGWRVWLLIDGAASGVLAAFFGFCAICWLASGYRLDGLLNAIYTLVFGFHGVGAVRFFLTSEQLGVWGERTDLQFDRQASEAAASEAPVLEVNSLAGELLRRTGGLRPGPSADAPLPAATPTDEKAPPAHASAHKPAPAKPATPRRPGPSAAPAPPPAAPEPPSLPAEAPEGFLAALARENDEDEQSRSS